LQIARVLLILHGRGYVKHDDDDDARERSINHLAEAEASSVMGEGLGWGRCAIVGPVPVNKVAGYGTQGCFRAVGNMRIDNGDEGKD